LLEHRFDETMPMIMKDIMSGRRLTELSLVIGYVVVIYIIACWATDGPIANSQLSLGVKTQDGSYSITASGGSRPVIRSIVGAQLDHHWAKSSDYPKHEISQGEFQDVLGHRPPRGLKPNWATETQRRHRILEGTAIKYEEIVGL
jgi:hypothetical protein